MSGSVAGVGTAAGVGVAAFAPTAAMAIIHDINELDAFMLS